ncbi:Transposase IS200 like protein [Clostridiales bacterium CHKCI001]|nr:Transposase IS200 like protein [Clostridiales bacterium CHKCI001]
MDKNSLNHTSWECKYHIVFAPKYRRQVIYGQIQKDVGEILSMLCRRKGIELIEGKLMKDHVHLLVRIPPKYSVAEIMGYLKRKSSLMIFERHAHMKYRYGNRKFWCRGYYVDTVGKNTEAIKRYIQNQIQEDMLYDQMSISEYIDPFTGEPSKKGGK